MIALTIHVSPNRTSYSTTRGTISAREAEECDLIAEALRNAGAQVTIVEQPGQAADCDFDLVFAADLAWHLGSRAVAPERLVILRPDRDEILQLAERHRVAAAVFYLDVAAWRKPATTLVVRRDVATDLGGQLGPGAPYFLDSEHYAAWRAPGKASLASQLVTYLRASGPSRGPLVSGSVAPARGPARIEISIDSAAAGMSVRRFPTPDTLVALSGPPGSPVAIVIWDCSEIDAENLELVIRAKLVAPWTTCVQVGAVERAEVLGEVRDTATFLTGTGQARMAWLGVIVKRPGGVVFVAAGVHASNLLQPVEILGNRAIAAAMATVRID